MAMKKPEMALLIPEGYEVRILDDTEDWYHEGVRAVVTVREC